MKKIITRQLSLKNNLKRYFIGEACKRGHVAERLTSNGTCFECRNTNEKAKEKSKIWSKLWRKNNPEKAKIRSRKNHEKNKIKESAYTKKWKKDNADHVKEYGLKYYRDNKEYYQKKHSEHCKKNPEVYRAYANNRRAKIVKSGGKYTPHDVKKIYDRQNGKCIYCKKVLGETYHVDHKKPLSRGGGNYPKNLQVTCPNCNLRKKGKTHNQFLKEL